MELKLTNGEYELEKQRLAVVTGVEELIQRIEMKLRARRGEFLPLPEYGSRLHLLQGVKPSEREAVAKGYVMEALGDESGLELSDLQVSESEQGVLTIDLYFNYSGQALSVSAQF